MYEVYKLYEIRGEMEQLLSSLSQRIDPETGEICEGGTEIGMTTDEILTALDALEGEKADKLQQVVRFRKNLAATIEAIRAEEKKLAERRKALENNMERIDSVIREMTGGQTTDFGFAKVSFRRVTPLVIEDQREVMCWAYEHERTDLLRIPEPEINKPELKKVIQAGEAVPGAYIETRQSMSIR